MKFLDRLFEKQARRLASNTSRRSMLIKVGRTLVITAFALPVLPFDRQARAEGHAANGGKKQAKDDTQCDYWRYCALDGYLCTCCGGTISQCPPGTEASKVAWVGTCHNPVDGKDYLISYNDCCGSSSCGRCGCLTNERERPAYRMGVHNDIDWCMANHSVAYHCTVAAVVGVNE